MVLQKEFSIISTRKIHRWLRGHVYLVCRFRTLFELKENTRDPKEKNRIEGKIRHLDKKIGEHMKYGETLNSLTEDQIKRLTATIREKRKKGKDPKTIIQEFIEEGGQI